MIGLMCAADGCPSAVEVFDGDTGDPSTLALPIEKLKQRFRLARVVLVGDRGMITSMRIAAELKPARLDWITALRAPAIQALAADGGPLQLSLFDQRDLAETASPDYPGERLVVCRNPALAEERRRKRNDLLDATARELARIQERVRRPRQPLQGAAAIGQAVGAVLGRRKVAEHFEITITDTDLSFARDEAAITSEAARDGFEPALGPAQPDPGVLRTSVPAAALAAPAVVRAYKSLARIEHAFRALKSGDLEVRPVFHWAAPRVRAHVFLCLLAYHLEWHLRQALAPVLFDDHDRAAAEAQRPSPVAKAEPSPAAKRKAKTKRTDDGLPGHSFRSLLADLATLTRNTVRLGREHTTQLLATPTPLQQRALNLLDIQPAL